MNKHCSPHIFMAVLAALLLLPVLATAQPLFTFGVNDLEAYNRTGNWIYDADGPTFPSDDGNWLTFSTTPGYPFHYFAETFIHQGTPTSIVCTVENVPLATSPGQIGISFTQFNLVAFKRINTVDPLAAWDIPGQSGDERVYANASGYITFEGAPVLKMNNATFIITTPYPSQAQIRALSPLLAGWTGNIGSGAPQTGFGFGELELSECDPAWAALFAASDYKVQLNMVGITSTVTQTAGYFEFGLEILPATVPNETGNEYLEITNLPFNVDFPAIDVGVEVLDAVPGGQNNDMQHIWLNEVLAAPSGALPDGLNFTTQKYWELGTTLTSFNVNLRFSLDSGDFGKAAEDWRILYRYNELHPWAVWQDFSLLSPNLISANNVSQIGEFTIASPNEENVPVVLSALFVTVNSSNQAVLNWATSSETDMVGFRVYASAANVLNDALCLTPVLIPAHNSSSGASYTFTANELEAPGTYYFWLESLDQDGNNDFFGPLVTTLDDFVPPLPERTALGNAYPNPFKQGSSASIAVDVKAGDSGSLGIYNLAGQRIASFAVQPGSQTVVWNGLDSRGTACASGIYFYRLDTATHKDTRKLVIVK